MMLLRLEGTGITGEFLHVNAVAVDRQERWNSNFRTVARLPTIHEFSTFCSNLRMANAKRRRRSIFILLPTLLFMLK